MAKKSEKNEFQAYAFGIPVVDRSIPDWHRTPGTFMAGQAEVDDLDLVAVEMEKRWGADRLRLLVDKELREKFDRQRYKLNQALWHGNLEDVRQESRRMIKAWQALDRAATEAGKAQAAPEIWEIPLSKGGVAVLLRDWQDAALFEAQRENRHAAVYTLAEIGRLIEGFPEVVRAKQVFPGAEVTQTRGPDRDPLRAIPDSHAPIDDVIPF